MELAIFTFAWFLFLSKYKTNGVLITALYLSNLDLFLRIVSFCIFVDYDAK